MPLNNQQASEELFPTVVPMLESELFFDETPKWRQFPDELYLVRGLDNRGIVMKSRIFVRSYDALNWAIMLKTNAVLGGRFILIYIQNLWVEEIEPSDGMKNFLTNNGLFASRNEAEAYRVKSSIPSVEFE